MRFRLVFCLLLCSLCALGQSGFHLINSKKNAVIPFKLINNLIFIQVEVNGEALTFLLDTGVEQTLLFSLDDKDEVQLFEVEKLKLKGLGSMEAIDSYKSSKNKVSVKNFIDLNHEIYIILDQEFNFSSQVGIPVNGIIGSKFFKNYIVEIDYNRKKITVSDHLNQKVQTRLQKKFARDSITIEDSKPYYISSIKSEGLNVPSKLLIDTGNSGAVWVFSSKTDKIKIPKKNIDDFLGRGFSGNVYGKRGRLESYEFGRKTFYLPLVTFPDSTSVKSVNFVPNRVGSVGSEVISRFTVVFDYKNSSIYTKPNSKINEPFHFNMSGIEVEHAGLEWVKEADNNSIKIYTTAPDEKIQSNLKIHFDLKPVFKIASVRTGSEADKSGLKIGDKILKINSHISHDFTIEKINELLKSEPGKIIIMEVERNNRSYEVKFQLKEII